MQALYTNDSAGEALWRVLTEIAQNLLGFGVYLLLFLSLDPVLVLIAAGSAVLSYLCARPGARWSYAPPEGGGRAGPADELHPEKGRRPGRPEGHPPLRHGGLAEGRVHLGCWTCTGTLPAGNSGCTCGATWRRCSSPLARNGAAYGYLLALTLREGLPAAQFLLYVTAVGNFTTWGDGHPPGLWGAAPVQPGTVQRPPVPGGPGTIPVRDRQAPLPPALASPMGCGWRTCPSATPGRRRTPSPTSTSPSPPGEKLAIVGLNGAGKTTLMKLCCGLLDPTGGRVLLNGEDIRDFNRRDYYRLFSTVFQDFSVFDTTFADNVTQIPECADTAGMEDAVKRAGLWERYRSLPQGGATHIGTGVYEDGIQLSGGELQRLMLARALYKNGPIIILDEPTAALDPIAEHQLYLRYSQLTQSRTSFYISHRLASTRFCDRIPPAGPGADRGGGHPPVPIGAGREVRRAL